MISGPLVTYKSFGHTARVVDLSAALPVCFKVFNVKSGGVSLNWRKISWGISTDSKNIYSQDLEKGYLGLLCFEDKVSLARVKPAYQHSPYSFSTLAQKPGYKRCFEVIETVNILDQTHVIIGRKNKAIEINGRFNFSDHSPGYAVLETRGRLDSDLRRIFPVDGHMFFLGLAKTALLREAAIRGRIFVRFSPVNRLLSVFSGANGTRALVGAKHLPKASAFDGGRTKLSVTLESLFPQLRAEIKRIERGKDRIEYAHIAWGICADPTKKAMFKKDECYFIAHEDRAVIVNRTSKQRWIVRLDSEGYVLNSRGKRYQRKDGSYVRKGQDSVLYINFWEIAQKQDACIFENPETGQAGFIDSLQAFMADPAANEGKVIYTKTTLNSNGACVFNVGGRPYTIFAQNLFHEYRGKSVYLAAKVICNEVQVSIHDAATKRHINTVRFDQKYNSFYSVGVNPDYRYFALTVPENRKADFNGMAIIFSVNQYPGQIVLLKVSPLGSISSYQPDVREHKSVFLVDENGNLKTMLIGSGFGDAQPGLNGYHPPVRLVQNSGHALLCNASVKRKYVIPVRWPFKAGDLIEPYFENGEVTHFRDPKDNKTYNYLLVRDEAGDIIRTSAAKLDEVNLPKMFTVENVLAAEDNVARSFRDTNNNRYQLQVTLSGWESRLLDAPVLYNFGNQQISLAAIAGEKVLYWKVAERFDAHDMRLVKSLFMRHSTPDKFNEESDKIPADKQAASNEYENQADALLERSQQIRHRLPYLKQVYALLFSATRANPYNISAINKLNQIRRDIFLFMAERESLINLRLAYARLMAFPYGKEILSQMQQLIISPDTSAWEMAYYLQLMCGSALINEDSIFPPVKGEFLLSYIHSIMLAEPIKARDALLILWRNPKTRYLVIYILMHPKHSRIDEINRDILWQSQLKGLIYRSMIASPNKETREFAKNHLRGIKP